MFHLKSPSTIFSLFVLVLLFAWMTYGQEPSSPSSNVPAPLHVGIEGQSKAGGLIINTGGAAIGLIVDKGLVGLGLRDPKQKLDVDGLVKAAGLCIGSDCRTSWPSGGTATAYLRWCLDANCTARCDAGDKAVDGTNIHQVYGIAPYAYSDYSFGPTSDGTGWTCGYSGRYGPIGPRQCYAACLKQTGKSQAKYERSCLVHQGGTCDAICDAGGRVVDKKVVGDGGGLPASMTIVPPEPESVYVGARLTDPESGYLGERLRCKRDAPSDVYPRDPQRCVATCQTS